MSHLRLVLAVVLSNFWIALPAHCQTPPLVFFHSASVNIHDFTISTETPGASSRDGIVGYTGITEDGVFTGPTTDTVTFIEGGSYTNNLFVYTDSTVNINGGRIKKSLILQDNSTLNLISGSVDIDIDAFGHSHVIVNPDGSVGGGIYAYTMSTVTVTGATIGGSVSANNDSSISMFDSTVGAISAGNGSVSFNNGTIRNGVAASGLHGQITLLNPMIGAGLHVYEHGAITIAGGQVDGSVDVEGNGVIGLSGNATVLGNITVSEDGQFTADTSSIHGGLVAEGTSTVNLNNSRQVLIQANHNAMISMSSGSVERVIVTDDATIVIDDGGAESVQTQNNGTLNYTGGGIGTAFASGGAMNLSHVSINTGLTASDEADVKLSDDSIVFGEIFLVGSNIMISHSNVSGQISALSSARVELEAVMVTRDISATNNTYYLLQNSHVVGDVYSEDHSGVAIVGGWVDGSLIAMNHSDITVSNVTVGGTGLALGGSTINWSGGSFGNGPPTLAPLQVESSGDLGVVPSVLSASLLARGASGIDPAQSTVTAVDTSTINIFGYDLETILIDPNYVNSLYADSFSVYELAGILADGTPLTGQFLFVQNNTGASYHLLAPVPEPATGTLLMLGMTAMLCLFAHRWAVS
jgi:hypothetical protein